ncbi:TPA: hypothetical protein ACH3X1_010397 [Trebouxia sp. C0004]
MKLQRSMHRLTVWYIYLLAAQTVTVCLNKISQAHAPAQQLFPFVLKAFSGQSRGASYCVCMQVHYGRASMSPLSCLPAYFVFGQQYLELATCAARIAQYAADKAQESEHRALLVFLDQVLLHAISQVQEHIKQIQQSYTDTLQIVFADVKLQSMEPHATAPSERATQPQPVPCSCKASSRGSMPLSAPTAADLPRQGIPAHGGRTNEAEPDSAKTLSSTPSEDGLSTPTSESIAADSRTVDNAHELSSQGAYASLRTAGADLHTHDGESAASSGQIAGYSWQLPPGVKQDSCIMMWIGADDVPALTHLHLTFNKMLWVMYNPEQNSWQEGLPIAISKTLKRRYFLVEKAKNANVIGILVGTLGVSGYKDAIDSIRALAKKAGKKTYTMLMGKPNPAKLANFPEVEIFVMVADPQGMILDSKEYYAPIITPYEAYMAFCGDLAWNGDYSLDFSSLQVRADGSQEHVRATSGELANQQPRFSLLDGAYHANTYSEDLDNGLEDDDGQTSTALAKRAHHALQLTGNNHQVTSASEYLQKRRTYRGLEAPIVGAESKPVVKAVQGQTGRAAQYQHEQEH